MDSKKTHFGFKQVDVDQKSQLVKNIFSNVASKYDLMNDLMSFGIHRIWKNKMIEKINPSRNCKIIDVASGTADIAMRLIKKTSAQSLNCSIDVVDINNDMLYMGMQRAVDANLFIPLNFICADGEKLPFLDNSFDYYTIAFGIRNFTNIEQGLIEAKRVLKDNGTLLCLEFSKVDDYFLQKIYDQYSFKIIPKIGEFVLKDRDSYQYLVESIRKFPSQNNFANMLKDVGFSKVTYQNLNYGVATIFEAKI